MDSQFKQRLTGAVILVLLAVLLVPEMLTGPKQTVATDPATAAAPAEGAPLRSYDIDLSESSPGAAPPPPRPAAPEPSAAPSRAPSSAPSAAPAPRVAAAAVATAPPMQGFAVQVGSFASRASADRLAADLERRRFDTFVLPVRSAGRQLFRVRVGPVADRAAAQALATRLAAAGQSGSVVALP